MILVPALLVTALVTLVLPAVTAFVTKANASTTVKQVVTAFLSAVSGLLITATQLDGTAVVSKEAALFALSTFIVTQATYWGLYKPHDANQKIAPEVGVG